MSSANYILAWRVSTGFRHTGGKGEYPSGQEHFHTGTDNSMQSELVLDALNRQVDLLLACH